MKSLNQGSILIRLDSIT